MWSFGSEHPQIMPTPKAHGYGTKGKRPLGWVALGGNRGSWATQTQTAGSIP